MTLAGVILGGLALASAYAAGLATRRGADHLLWRRVGAERARARAATLRAERLAATLDEADAALIWAEHRLAVLRRLSEPSEQDVWTAAALVTRARLRMAHSRQEVE